MDYEALGRAWVDDRPWALLSDLTALGGRMGGSEAERRAADRLVDALAAVGARDVRIDSFEMRRWTRGDSHLEVTTTDDRSRSFEAVALPYAPTATVEGPLVDVGHGTPAEVDETDVSGAVAVASTTTPPGGRFVHRMEKFGHALAAGAEAFVFANHVPGQLPPTGALRFGEEAAAPAVGVASEADEWLREYADDGGHARLTVEASTADSTSQNVVGHVGPDTEETVLLVAHYDGHDVGEGALDNACGVATVVTAARVLAACESLPVGVTVALVGCEEVGLLGAEHLADRLDLGTVRAVVNVDGAGRHRDPIAMTHASAAVGEAVERVADRTRQPVTVDSDPHPFSDHWPFVRRGVPALQLHSDSGERGRGWGHTRADTRDKVDDRTVREHGMLAALLVEELAETDLPRLPASTLAAALRETDYERGMRAAELWPDEWD